MNGKEVRIFLKGQAKEAYLELKKRQDKEARSILRSIERVKGILKENPQFGDPIKKDLIPISLKALGIQICIGWSCLIFGECYTQSMVMK